MRTMPDHGGDLRWASATFRIPEDDWLDLSTGVSPWAWPVEQWPPEVFRSLPPGLGALRESAARYYGCDAASLLPVAGSQQAIRLIPHLITRSTVAVPAVGYQEHAQAWQAAGHCVRHYGDFEELSAIAAAGVVDHAVVINPNNPLASRVSRSQLLTLHNLLTRRPQPDRLMLVDEAFGDLDPSHSLATERLPNLLVLRSFGKFFGLAGLRLGFVIDHSRQWLKRIEDFQGAWAISHPAVHVAERALRDTAWIAAQRRRIDAANQTLHASLNEAFGKQSIPAELANGGLFITAFGDDAQLLDLFEQLAHQAILTRFGRIRPGHGWLRFGLAADYRRLHEVMNTLAQAASEPDNIKRSI